MARAKARSEKGSPRRDRAVRGRAANGLQENISTHDRFQVEVKRNYVPGHAGQTRYELFTYLFLPSSLGVSSRTYAPADYYRQVQNYVRLRTPRLNADELFTSPDSPLAALESVSAGAPLAADAVIANLKLLRPVAKVVLNGLSGQESPSASADAKADAYLARSERIVDFCETLLSRARALEQPLAALGSGQIEGAYRLVDETLSVLAEQTLLERHEGLERRGDGKKSKKLRTRIREIVAREHQRRERARSDAGVPPLRDDDFIERLSLLKKYSAEALYLQTERKPEGKAFEHLALAAAAGLAMAFATLLTFFSQRFWHSYSVELFLAFVGGYMFKDRIKEIARAWLGSKLNKRLDDHRLILRSRDGKRQLGLIRERVRFLNVEAVPEDVLRSRRSWTEHALLDAAKTRGEVVLMHRREVAFDPAALGAVGERARSDGLSDISRLDVRPFLTKMDNPRERRRRFQGEQVETVRYQRTYPVYLITAVRSSPSDSPRAVTAARILLNRKGVRRIESLESQVAEAAA